MVIWAEIAQLLGALMPVTPLPAHWWRPLLRHGAFEATDWDWEQMQPHHTLRTPPRSPSHFTLTYPVPPPSPKATKLLSWFYSPLTQLNVNCSSALVYTDSHQSWDQTTVFFDRWFIWTNSTCSVSPLFCSPSTSCSVPCHHLQFVMVLTSVVFWKHTINMLHSR